MHNVNHIHSCSYYCDRPECIKEQRDSLVKKLEDTLAQTSKGEEMSDLRKTAQALVDRWDTPLWKDVPHTGVFIDALRAALAEPEPCADEFDCDHMPWCRIRKTCQKQARAALAQPEPEPVAWVLDGDKDCRYSHWLGQTQFGRILITWKGWKECCDASVDEFPGGFKAYGSPDEVKAACETELIRRCGCNLSQRNPLSLDAINKVCAAPHLTVSDFVRAIERAHGIGGES